MLGHLVLKVLSREKDWEVQGLSSRDFYATNKGDFDFVINCAGALSGSDESQLYEVNAELPKRLADTMRAKIIHISTDGVFSGKSGPYDENSPPDATDAYGKSKLAGEVNAPNVLNIRTSIIGPSPYKKKGLLEWFLSQPDGTIVKGYTNHVWNGITTLQFAQLCEKILRNDIFDELRRESAVFHFAPNGPITKYELLVLFKKVFKKNISVEPTEDPRGSIERVLKTKCVGLKKFFPHGLSMREAAEQLSVVM